jgi:hypothetical protein
MLWQVLLWFLPVVMGIVLRQIMQAGHLNFLNAYLRQILMAVIVGYTLLGLHAGETYAVWLHSAYGGYPVRAYLIVGALGAALFCGYWALIEKIIPASASSASTKPGTSSGPQQQDSKTPAESKPEEKKSVEAGQKKKEGKHKTVVQEGQGNVNIEQHSEGPNSPNVATTGPNSPVTINPPVNPNAPVVTYDFNGVKHIQNGSKFVAEAGEQFSKFQEMATLEKEQKWDDLRKEAESQISAAPGWLTSYLLAAEAHANLGNKAKAIELCEHVKKESGGREEFDTPADKLIALLKQKP